MSTNHQAWIQSLIAETLRQAAAGWTVIETPEGVALLHTTGAHFLIRVNAAKLEVAP